MEWLAIGAWALMFYLAYQIDKLGKQVRKLSERIQSLESRNSQL